LFEAFLFLALQMYFCVCFCVKNKEIGVFVGVTSENIKIRFVREK